LGHEWQRHNCSHRITAIEAVFVIVRRRLIAILSACLADSSSRGGILSSAQFARGIHYRFIRYAPVVAGRNCKKLSRACFGASEIAIKSTGRVTVSHIHQQMLEHTVCRYQTHKCTLCKENKWQTLSLGCYIHNGTYLTLFLTLTITLALLLRLRLVG